MKNLYYKMFEDQVVPEDIDKAISDQVYTYAAHSVYTPAARLLDFTLILIDDLNQLP